MSLPGESANGFRPNMFFTLVRRHVPRALRLVIDGFCGLPRCGPHTQCTELSAVLLARVIRAWSCSGRGAAAAFFRPAIPYQVEVDISKPVSFPIQSVDLALDNPDIAEDQNISPARKCGFCMG